MKAGVSGLQRYCCGEPGQRIIVPFQTVQNICANGMKFGISRSKGQSSLAARKRVVETLDLRQRLTPIAVSLGVVRVYTNCFIETGNRFLEPFPGHQDVAAVKVCRSQSRVQ